MLVRALLLIVEFVLGIVCVTVLALCSIYWNRPIYVGKDTASIADLMELLPDDDRRRRVFSTSSDLTALELETKFYGERFKIEQILDTRNSHPIIVPVTESDVSSGSSLVIQPIPPKGHRIKGLRPMELKMPISTTFALALVGTLMLLAFLYQRDRVSDGLPTPLESVILRQLLLNYLPTAFATLVEPTWVLLSRQLCILQLFEVLRAGNASARESLRSRYTSVPP